MLSRINWGLMTARCDWAGLMLASEFRIPRKFRIRQGRRGCLEEGGWQGMCGSSSEALSLATSLQISTAN